jgi:hypothetical protein
MKAVAKYSHWKFTTKYVLYKDYIGLVLRYIEGLEDDLLKVVWEHMNMTFM